MSATPPLDLTIHYPVVVDGKVLGTLMMAHANLMRVPNCPRRLASYQRCLDILNGQRKWLTDEQMASITPPIKP